MRDGKRMKKQETMIDEIMSEGLIYLKPEF